MSTSEERLQARISELESKSAKRRNAIAALEKRLEDEISSKRDHVFRLRTILSGMLDGDPAAATKARRELGREK